MNDIYLVIQWTIMREMIHLLETDGSESVEDWAVERKRRFEELNNFVISVLGYNRPDIVRSIQNTIDEAQDTIATHLKQQWDIEMDRGKGQAQQVADYLNRDVMRALYSTSARKGTVQIAYEQIIGDVQSQYKDDSDIMALLALIIPDILENGFYSGYIQSDGVRWRMDRVVQSIYQHIFVDAFSFGFGQLTSHGVELVRVNAFNEPREACSKLQASGIICIAKREEASQEALRYPNIWDDEHRYLEMGGHHGADGNCRHVWYSVDSDGSLVDIWQSVDKQRRMLEVGRARLDQLLDQYIS